MRFRLKEGEDLKTLARRTSLKGIPFDQVEPPSLTKSGSGSHDK